ncbi:hypothetical protein NC652_007664 [Populus alba x Populus x berolinensis]|uniref:Uncharacterized protein n=1 Tax=Populus alba x Populus x berolinensis TaxID=444605 RepID=A0AAD6RHB6_9ROSI|nr:hypothetical protein NC652_007664 [Populus alba x Populus x berolinensis]KAJ7009028.1 hypothetical protein NC653_007621 [Populus alba x Populus x berolinensis]
MSFPSSLLGNNYPLVSRLKLHGKTSL